MASFLEVFFFGDFMQLSLNLDPIIKTETEFYKGWKIVANQREKSLMVKEECEYNPCDHLDDYDLYDDCYDFYHR